LPLPPGVLPAAGEPACAVAPVAAAVVEGLDAGIDVFDDWAGRGSREAGSRQSRGS
jgi:hypothetical protein